MRDVPPLDALELFRAVARHGSISAAAREVGLSQQSASTRIRSIERNLGIELLTRSTRGTVLTEAGELVLGWTEDLLNTATRFRAGVEALRGESSRTLIVAASQTAATYLVPHWMLGFRSAQLASGQMPTEVQILAANSTQVGEIVRTGRADLGVVESPDLPDDLSSTTIANDELALVVPPDHPWIRRRSLPLDEVASTPLIFREEGSGTRRAWEAVVFERLRRAPAEPAAVMSTTSAIRSAVADGIAPAVVSTHVVADDIALGRLRRVALDGPALTRPITALWRGSDRDLRQTSRDFLDAARTAR